MPRNSTESKEKKKKKGLRPDGRYQARVKIGGESKLFYSTVSYADAKKKGLAETDEWDRKHAAPNYRDITLGKWLEEWLEAKEGNIDDSSWQRHETNIRVHITPKIGDTPLADVTSPLVLEFMNDLKNTVVCRKKKPTPEDLEKAKKLSVRTQKYIFDTLNGALEKARLMKVITENPCEPIDKPAVPRKLPKPLTKEEEAKYLAEVVKDPFLHTISIVARDSGFRSGELLHLTWDNVFFNTGHILIVKGKTELSSRKTPLPKRSMKLLKEHKKRQDQLIKECGLKYHDNDLVFPDKNGDPIPNFTLSRMFKKAATRAGIRPDATFHNLRDTFATELLELGVHPFEVQAMLGHATLQMTRNYSKVTGQLHKAVIQKMNRERNKQKNESSQKVVKKQRTIKKISLRERPRG